MWTAGPSPRRSASNGDARCAQDATTRHPARITWAHDHKRFLAKRMRVAGLIRLVQGYDSRDRARGAVTIDSSTSAALLRRRATCRTTWKSRSGRLKRTRCSSPASRLGAATDAEIAVAPSPASTAARTTSLDGSSSAIRDAPGRHAKALQCRFECRSRAGSRFAQDPVGFDQPIRLESVNR